MLWYVRRGKESPWTRLERCLEKLDARFARITHKIADSVVCVPRLNLGMIFTC